MQYHVHLKLPREILESVGKLLETLSFQRGVKRFVAKICESFVDSSWQWMLSDVLNKKPHLIGFHTIIYMQY